MRLNPDCIRDILITVEDAPFGTYLSFDDLCSQLPQHKQDDIHYACLKLNEGGMLNIISKNYLGSNVATIVKIKDITYLGHDFLNNIKSDNSWNKTKEIAKQVGSYSISTLKDISVQVISELIKQRF